jgi:hypothetical protein
VSQPYDLSGLATLTATLDQMLSDQQSGAVNFAGSAETWIPSPAGWFKAIVQPSGSPVPTTANQQRTAFKTVRTIIDALAGGTGSVAAGAIQANTPPSILLETGRSPTGPQQGFGPVMNGASFVAPTSYDLSGIAGMQAAANAMLADMLSGVTSFVGWAETWVRVPKGQFQAIMVPLGSPQTVTLGTALPLMNEIRRKLDLVGTARRLTLGPVLIAEGSGAVLVTENSGFELVSE